MHHDGFRRRSSLLLVHMATPVHQHQKVSAPKRRRMQVQVTIYHLYDNDNNIGVARSKEHAAGQLAARCVVSVGVHDYVSVRFFRQSQSLAKRVKQDDDQSWSNCKAYLAQSD